MPLYPNTATPTTSSAAYGSTTTLTAATQSLLVGASGSGTTTVNAPVVSGVIATGWVFTVSDSGATSNTNNITVHGNGANIEDPNTPGTFSSSVTMTVNSGSVEWMYDGTHWKIVWAFYPAASAFGGYATQTVNSGSTPLQANANTIVLADTSSVAVTVKPPPSGTVPVGTIFGVIDTRNNAATNNITVGALSGGQIESPSTPGSFGTSVSITVNSQSVVWIYGGITGGINAWKILSVDNVSSSGGITVQNNGTGIANNPHTTLNLIGWMKATDSGSGVAALVALPTTATVAYGTTTTLSAATTALIVGLTGSGATTVNAPPVSGVITTGWLFVVIDSGANSLNNNITVSGNSVNIEDPFSPGTFSSSVVLRINSGGAAWMYDGSHWKIAYAFYPQRITVFVTTTNSGPLTFFTYPLTSGNMVSLKTRWSMRDITTATNNTQGEAVAAAYNVGAGVVNQTITGSGSTLPGNLIWRTGSGNVTATTAGAGNQISLQFAGGGGINTNHWRFDIEAIQST